jgi:tripeptidyl-peptidase-1
VSGYSSNGRGYPDVSLLAHSYKVYIGGNSYSVDGTSASTPVFSAFLALINSQRKNIGLGTLGFVQPLLYSSYTSWLKVDINSGNNKCCAKTSSTICCSQGFTAVNGWDPVTGLGSVNYASLSASLDVSSAPTFIPTIAPTSAASASVSTSTMVLSAIVTIGLILSAIF